MCVCVVCVCVCVCVCVVCLFVLCVCLFVSRECALLLRALFMCLSGLQLDEGVWLSLFVTCSPCPIFFASCFTNFIPLLLLLWSISFGLDQASFVSFFFFFFAQANNRTKHKPQCISVKFPTGECDVAAIPDHEVCKELVSDPATLDCFLRAKGQVAVNEALAVQMREMKIREAEMRDPLSWAKSQVEKALTQGQSTQCPQCSEGGGCKDDQCMHISCEQCGCRWCYACGKARYFPGGGDEDDDDDGDELDEAKYCTGCDSENVYLHYNRGWLAFARNGETAGEGAVMELHRRRMAVLVKQVQHDVEEKVSGGFLFFDWDGWRPYICF